MRVKIQSCTRELRKLRDGRDATGLKIDGKWYDAPGDHRDKYNKEVEVELSGKFAKIIEANADAGSSSNGHSGAASLEDLKNFMFEAHKIAVMLEGDSTDERPDSNPVYFDRAQARAAIVNTLVIAFTNGKIALPDGPPPPDDSDNIPF
jgi:hypothetical protein